MKKLTLWLSAALIGVFALSSRPVATQSTSTNSIVLFADAYDLDSTTTIYCDTGATYPTGTVAACTTGSAAGDGWITVSGYGNVAVIVDVDAVDNNITVVVEARYRNASPVTTDTITIADAFDVISAAGVQTFVLNIPADQIRVGVSVAAGGEGTDEDLEVIVYRSFNGLTAGLSSGGGAAIASGSGTANTVVKFDASGDLADSQVTDDGTTLDMTVAGVTFTNDGADTIVTGDAGLTFLAGGTSSINFSQTGADLLFFNATANISIFDYSVSIPITAAGQTTNLLGITPTNANHTGGTVNAVNIGAITGDIDATEVAVNISSGWEKGIVTAVVNTVMEMTSADSQLIFSFPSSAGGNISLREAGAISVALFDSGSQGNIWHFTTGASGWHNGVAATSGLFEIDSGTMVAADGSDTKNMLFLDVENVNHTGTGNTINVIAIDDIVGDANANTNGIFIDTFTGTVGAAGELESAIKINSGWDSAILLDDDLTDYITFENGNGSFRNHTSPGYFIFPPGFDNSYADLNGSTLGGAADNVRVWRWYVDRRLTVSRIVWHITTGGAAGAECSAGLYTSDGATLLINSGAQVCTGADTMHDIDVTDVTIGPGFYIFAVTADDAAVEWTVSSAATIDEEGGELLNSTTVQIGNAANASANAVLPATVGTITGVGNRGFAVIKLQG